MTDNSDREDREEQYEERGGEAACWAHLVCPECGAMESEGHRPACPADRPRAQPQPQANTAIDTAADRQP